MDNPMTQTIPHDQEAEQAILGSILYDNSVIDDVLLNIAPHNFFMLAHQHIFTAMVHLYKQEKPIDEILLGDVLKKYTQLEDVGGFNYIASLVDCSPDVSNISGYVDIVSEHYQKREVMLLASNSSKTARDPQKPASEIINDSLSKLTELSESLHTKTNLNPVKEIIIGVFEDLEKVSESKNEITGLATGFTDLDGVLLGLQPSDLVVLAARPSMGKTALALNIATYAATRGNYEGDVLIFSYEMGKKQLVLRMASSMAKVDSKKLKTGNLSQDEWDKLAMASSEIIKMPLYIDDSVPTLSKLVSIAIQHSKKNKIAMIIVDYMQIIPLDRKNLPREQQVSEISRSLKLLAKKIDCPVLALSQLNRGLESRGDKRPKLSDLRESGAIEQDADIIMFIYRDEVYDEDTPDKGIAELDIAKNRNGPTRTIKLSWIGKYTRFANLFDRY